MRLLLLFMLAVLAPVLRGGEIFDFARLSDRIELVHYQKGSAAKVGKIDGRDALELFLIPPGTAGTQSRSKTTSARACRCSANAGSRWRSGCPGIMPSGA